MNQPHYIAIRTCNRPAYLQRLLLSVARRQAGSPVCVLVFDDSRDCAIRARNQQAVESAVRRFGRGSAGYPGLGARYLGTEWQQDFISRLIRLVPADAHSIHWLLTQGPEGTFTGGRLLNIIMLALAGHRFTLFDDDYLLDRPRHLGLGYSREVDWSRNPPRQVLAHASLRESRAAGLEFERDPIDAHMEFLGRRLQDCLEVAEGDTEPLLDASHAGAPPDRLQLNKDSVILTTLNGQFGVPVAPNFFHLFYQAHGEEVPLWADPDKYRLLRRGRAIWSLTRGPVIAGRTGSTPSGVDNRHLMPPTLPHGKGEDTLFCIMVKYLHPNAAHLYLPWAIEHSRKPVPWAYATFDQPQRIMLSRTIWKNVEEFAGSADRAGTVEDRLGLLAQYWLEWSARDRVVLKTEIIDSFKRGARWRAKIMRECLELVPDSRLQVHRDLQRALKVYKSCLELEDALPELHENPGLQGDARRVEWLAGIGREFGLAAGAWWRLWHAAREMQAMA